MFCNLLAGKLGIYKKHFFTVVIGPTPFNFMVIRQTQVQEHKNLFIFILTGLNKKEYSLWQSDLLLLLPDIYSCNHGVFFIQHDQICTTRDVIYASVNLESSHFKDKMTKYINKFPP